MKSLRWLTPVLFVLFVWVLMAPVQSEAATSLKLTLLDQNGARLTYPNTTPPNAFPVPDIEITLPAQGGCSSPTDPNGPDPANSECFLIPLDLYCPNAGPDIIGQSEPRVAAPLKVRYSGSAHESFVPSSAQSNITRVSQ